jgi:hypothetical protein
MTKSEGREEYHTYTYGARRKANWVVYILRRNCLLKQVIEGKIEGGLEVTRRRGRRHRKLQYLQLKNTIPRYIT